MLQVTRCSNCGGTLDLPVVHFLCKHSFHQRCIHETNDDVECPRCYDNNSAVRTVVRSREELADRQEFFREGLNEAKDKAEFIFSRLDVGLE